ncbi:MAG: SDR family NAD(P)-dependent oxidoreductase [Anaerolineales bacterium]|nr:SDR family NAD(P)-dependent oxidoreductase [Anaerolineales bacterium]
MTDSPLISTLGLAQDTLKGKTVIVTGAGGGIGYEAARALLWLGANVVIAEIDPESGGQAAKTLGGEFDPERILFVQTDVGEEASVENLYQQAVSRFGKADAVINNATIAVLGLVTELPIEKWDASYRVNLRGPVLLAKRFIPDMSRRGYGSFLCVSSTGAAYLGGYETFKAAQVHLSTTLDAELEGSGVNVFTIGPGLVPTQTATAAVKQVAPAMGMSEEEFYELNRGAMLSVEEAGAGFAAAVVFADKFKGMEISSIQALKAADISYGSSLAEGQSTIRSAETRWQAAELCKQVWTTLKEQSDGWKTRSIFERQWVIRDFRKTAGMSVEEWLDILHHLAMDLQSGTDFTLPPLERLSGYYDHLAELAKGYEKDPQKLEENLTHVYHWRDEVIELIRLLR